MPREHRSRVAMQRTTTPYGYSPAEHLLVALVLLPLLVPFHAVGFPMTITA
ncbi:hypothetical protein GGR56DRAFT_671199 [Xylariaceae sp. FL0804]|nr:hypothetical protein GGR56DRAFT_671199 [Xylariaceae sp. FL0804]